ncbi:3-oxoacyl-[acyl-carrier-protein] synthase III C-terminal domain-containing protein [Streptomyces sp. NPDC050625]|uniref:3-oxoacyl-[acyl-carrier-protein] synthase III C-terminal domain-containing protein n=1 Tax=Streptomyces sp. NPDC050625 TaxID=3154629 RepID=UPI003413F14F
MTHARIAALSFRTPPLVKMAELAGHVASDVGGFAIAKVVGNSAISTKGMAVNMLAEDPRWWSTRQRMDRGLAEASRLGGAAVLEALGRAGLRARDVGLLATVTTTTHSAPGLDALAPALGMRENVEILSLGPMGCYAALPALTTCAHWVAARRKPAVLLAVDLFSPHMQPPPYDKEAAVVWTLFGDGAAAVVLLPDKDKRGASGTQVVDAEQLTVPAHAEDLQVHVGDLGLRIRLAPTMPDVVASAVGVPAKALLARNRLAWGDVVWWAVHPGGRRILDRVEDAIGLPEDSMAVARAAMRAYGNTAAPAVLGVLQRLQTARPLAPEEHGVVLAFGPGATIWAVLLRGA